MKKMVETQIPFAASADFDAKEGEIFKTHNCLHCGVAIVIENDLALHRNEKHSRIDKLYVYSISGVSTAGVD